MKVKAIPVHKLSHIYEAYAASIIAQNSDYFGRSYHNIKNYYIYIRKGERREEILNYRQFRQIVEQYFDRAKTAIINGEALHINCIGKICAKHIERDFRNGNKRQVNWGKSNKYKEWSEEKQKMVYTKLVYHTEDTYLRVGWFKQGIPNETMYEFDPTEANEARTSGFKLEFSEANKKDPTLRFRYPYYPIKDYVQETT